MAGSVVGIDVGSSTIKLAEMTGSPGALRLHRLAVAQTPSDAYYSGAIIDPISLGNAIGGLLAQHRFGSKRAAVALSGTENCGLRVQEYPRMPDRDLRATIRSDAERLFPFQSDLKADFAILQSSATTDTVEVVIAGARKEFIQNWCVALRQAKLMPAVFDMAPLAQVVSLVEAGQRRERCMLLVDIGEIASAISVVQDGVLRFVRYTEEASGRKLTKAVSLEVKPDTDDEAERIKIRFGNVAMDYSQGHEYYTPEDWERDTMTMGMAEDHDEMVIAMNATSRPVDDEPTLVMPTTRAGRAADDLFGDLGDPAGSDEVFIPATRPGTATEPMPKVEDAGHPATATQPVPPIETPDVPEDVPPAPAFHEPAGPAGPTAPAAGGADFIIEEPTLQPDAAGFAPAFDPTRAVAPDDEAYARQLVGQAVVEPLAQLAAEIRRSIEYYRGRHQDVVPQRILLLGGTALLPNLAEFLERELGDLGIPVECGDPLLNVAVDERVTPHDYIASARPVVATAVGMCLREII